MKTYEITIKPLSGFGSSLKGDTIFGHICWQAAYDDKLFGNTIDTLLSDYGANPFLIVSSAYPKFYQEKKSVYMLKRPELPLDDLFNFKGMDKKMKIMERKKIKAKKWMQVEETLAISSFAKMIYKDDKELFELVKTSVTDSLRREAKKRGMKSFITHLDQSHNTINRLTGTTGEGRFAPFAVEQSVYFPETELAIFVGINELIKIEHVEEALKRIGDFGFGKDASTGLGKFDVCDANKINLRSFGSLTPNACYTLSPCVPEKDVFSDIYFSPFTRFGRHGDILAKSKNPFKNPVIMADEGAVLISKQQDVFLKPYIGTAVTNISLAQEHKSVMQGYSLYIPVKVEV